MGHECGTIDMTRQELNKRMTTFVLVQWQGGYEREKREQGAKDRTHNSAQTKTGIFFSGFSMEDFWGPRGIWKMKASTSRDRITISTPRVGKNFILAVLGAFRLSPPQMTSWMITFYHSIHTWRLVVYTFSIFHHRHQLLDTGPSTLSVVPEFFAQVIVGSFIKDDLSSSSFFLFRYIDNYSGRISHLRILDASAKNTFESPDTPKIAS